MEEEGGRPVMFVAILSLSYNSWMDTGPGVPGFQRIVYSSSVGITSPLDGSMNGLYCAEITLAKPRTKVQMITNMFERMLRDQLQVFQKHPIVNEAFITFRDNGQWGIEIARA